MSLWPVRESAESHGPATAADHISRGEPGWSYRTPYFDLKSPTPDRFISYLLYPYPPRILLKLNIIVYPY